MAELVVIAYPDEGTANQALDTLHRLEKDLVVQLGGSAVVVCDQDGKIRMATKTHATGAGATSGALWGMLIGLLFFVPVAGLLIGGAFGALFGSFASTGIKQEFISQVQGLMKPGTAAVVAMVQKATPDKALAALAPFGGTLLKTSLSEDAEKHIQEQLDAATKAADTTPAADAAPATDATPA